jgi:hypothetical protein
MSTAASNPKPSAPPELTTKPAPQADREEETWTREPEERPADRTALVFWLIAFALLAFVTFCDLVISLFR